MKKSYSGGYVAILLLFVGVAIMIFLMAQQYEKIAQRRQDTLRQENAANGDTSSVHPIDRALDIKATVEARDRAMLGQ
jgi:hypothetical protein